MCDLDVSHARKKYELRDSDVLKVKNHFLNDVHKEYGRLILKMYVIDFADIIYQMIVYNI